jgi:hypothetical protein
VAHKNDLNSVEQHLQVLDVGIVDVLSHLEALLRHSHSIQRALLQLRSEAPPPTPKLPEHVTGVLTERAEEMEHEWIMLGEILRDLAIGIQRLSGGQHPSERRSGKDRREMFVNTGRRVHK